MKPFASLKSIVTIGAAVLGASLGVTQSASAFTVTKDDVGADDMLGMTITVNYANNTNSSFIWGDDGVLDSEFGFISLDAEQWALGNPVEGDNTYNDLWAMFNGSTESIASIVLDGLPGHTAFDNFRNALFASDGIEGFQGSQNGTPFTVIDDPGVGAIASYENALCSTSAQLSTTTSGCDLYGTLRLSFSNFSSGSFFTFTVDTDNVIASASVPESSPVLPLMLGLLFPLAQVFKRQPNP